MTYFGTP